MTDFDAPSRRFTRGTGPDAMRWDDGVRAVQHALDTVDEAEFTEAGPDGSTLTVWIIRGQRALTVWGPRGVVGVFASVPAAIRHAFHLLDRAAAHQRAARPRPARARRRTTEKATAP